MQAAPRSAEAGTAPEIRTRPAAPPDEGETAIAAAEAEKLAVGTLPGTAADAPVETAAPEPDVGPDPVRQVAILKSDEEGVKAIRPATPAAPDLMGKVALDTISYATDGGVKLQGRAAEDAEEVRVYLDNRVIAALKVDEAGNWRGALPDIDTGVYTLRLDEVDKLGQVTSRVETPFKREDPVVLAAATPMTRLEVETMPSLAPMTAARSQTVR